MAWVEILVRTHDGDSMIEVVDMKGEMPRVEITGLQRRVLNDWCAAVLLLMQGRLGTAGSEK